MGKPEPALVGRKVRLDDSGEVGIIIHTWWDEVGDTLDCYIAFFGDHFPEGKPQRIPYVLRYWVAGLTLLD